MKMPPIQTPSQIQLDRFAISVSKAMPAGLSASTAMQRNSVVGRWLMRLGDYLPRELSERGIACHKAGKGVVYEIGGKGALKCFKAEQAENKAAAKAKREAEAINRKVARAADKGDWAFVAAHIPAWEWRALADHIHAAGVLSYAEALQPFAQSLLCNVVVKHPLRLPKQLEELGISFDSNTKTYSGL